ncbi:MAG TPA: recombination protein NinG [Elusimicrobiota bacterium]|jgi:hypothetical protein|nr:recombination protein NinG [Elusimicrobiota bacterium]
MWANRTGFREKRLAAQERRDKREEKRQSLPWGKRQSGARSYVHVLKDLLDRLFSEFIRRRDQKARGYCPFHAIAAKPIQCCFHFFMRAKEAIRWDARNAAGSCDDCNVRYEHDSEFVKTVTAWYIAEHGQAAYDQLLADGNRIADFSVDDLEKKRDELKRGISGAWR